MLPHLHRPCLRPGLALDEKSEPGSLLLFDRFRLVPQALRITALELAVLRLFQGTASLLEIQSALIDSAGNVSLEALARFAAQLDDLTFLEGPRFEAQVNRSVRPPACIGCYSDDPVELDDQMRRLFLAAGGPGLPAPMPLDNSLTGALVPHIDFARGGVTYGWGFKEVHEHSQADLFVIIGTSHYSGHRFTLTRQDFQTPLGIVPTDQAFIDRIVSVYGDGLFDDRLAHVPEHSIELEVVVLRWLRPQRPFRIVPLLVGSFHDCVRQGRLPEEQKEIAKLIAALQTAARETSETICYLISGDLAHIGPKFDDPHPVTPSQMVQQRLRDERLLDCVCRGDEEGYFREIAVDGDARRICGFPPTTVFLSALGDTRGRPLHYGQYRHPAGREAVTFASVGFYG